MLLQPGDKIGYTESINQPTKVRLPDGREVAITDWSWRTLYSCVDILSGATDPQLPAFSYSLGQNVKASNNVASTALRAATLQDTNLDAGESKMPAEQEFICYAIAVDVQQFVYADNQTGEAAYTVAAPALPVPTAGNLAYAMLRLSVSLEVTQKDFFQNKLGWFSSGGGPLVSANGNAAAAIRTYAANGLPTKQAIDTSPVPVHIGGTETYAVLFQNGTGAAINWLSEAGATDATAVLRFTASMIGLHKRPSA
jgi:hypothetical protein